MFAILKWLLFLVSLLLVAAFAVANRHYVSLEFYPLPISIEMPVYLFMIALFCFGYSVAWTSALLKRLHLRRKLRQDKHRTQALEEEVTRLRHLGAD